MASFYVSSVSYGTSSIPVVKSTISNVTNSNTPGTTFAVGTTSADGTWLATGTTFADWTTSDIGRSSVAKESTVGSTLEAGKNYVVMTFPTSVTDFTLLGQQVLLLDPTQSQLVQPLGLLGLLLRLLGQPLHQSNNRRLNHQLS
jgi:hypothetical protein